MTRVPFNNDILLQYVKHYSTTLFPPFFLQTAHFVIQKRAQLIQKVNTVMAIVDSLGTMVHHEFRAKIQAQETRMDQMRLLYTLMPDKGGVNIKAAFYDALKQHERHLLESMGKIRFSNKLLLYFSVRSTSRILSTRLMCYFLL